jgi:dihydroorotase
MNANPLSIRHGRLIDPAHGVDGFYDLHIAAGRVVAVGAPPPGFSAEQEIDARGLVVCPGLIDLCAHLREPGFEHKATIASETAAAASAGITTLCCTPDTAPVNDTPAVTELIRRKAQSHGHARLLPMGALTQGLLGEQLSEMAALQRAGCIVMSNGDAPIINTLVLRRALEYAATFGLTTFLTPEDPWLRDQGCVHEGKIAARLGLPGIPEAAETAAMARDLALAAHTGARVHIHGLSCGTATRMLARAQREGLAVTADVSAHQLHLSEMDVEGFNSYCHVIPPLRTDTDRGALRRALAEGHIAAICSDHQPHEADAKRRPFPSTEPGISGLETLLPLTLRLVEEGVLSLGAALARLTVGPAQILDLPLGQLAPGATADVCIFDPAHRWTLEAESLRSRGHNTPFLGWDFSGRVTHTLLEGRLVFERNGGVIKPSS